jgi:hypothetical protein
MISLIYISSATRLLSEEQLLQLLEQLRDNNARRGITGILLYKGGNIMQVLEGEDEAVRTLFAKIQQDQRHRGVFKLLEEPIKDRQFSSFTMGFRNLDRMDPEEVPGYSDFLNESLASKAFRNNPTRAQRMLLLFRRHM